LNITVSFPSLLLLFRKSAEWIVAGALLSNVGLTFLESGGLLARKQNA
jgi:hypothetical protein